MIFIETPVFTKRLGALLDDDSYAAFQRELAMRPDMGDVIEGTGGLKCGLHQRVTASVAGPG